MSNDTRPEIRFPEFTEAWEERKLSDIADKAVDNRGKTPTISEDGNHPLLEVASLGNGAPDYSKVTKYLSDETFMAELRAYIKEGDILFSTVGSIGLVSLMDTNENAAIAQNIVAFRANEKYDSKFLYAMLSTKDNQHKAQRIVMGAVQPSIKVSQLVDVDYCVTENMEEQRKLGEYFLNLDNLITLHQRKLDLLKETKKGFLQKMFPKNGAKVPEIRFPGFTEDWEQRKLGDVTAEVFQGINTAGDKVEYSDTGTPILQAKHITGGDVTFDEARFLDKERYSNYFPKYVPVENDILFANIGTIGPSTVVRDESEFLVAWNILKITLKKPEIAEFIQLQLDQLNQKHYFDSVLTGNATKFVNKDEMLRTPISVPTIEEQKKVGVFFSNIQRAITLHQRKLDLLKETKKGFLQKMFV